jgi:hypothetical protein
MNMSRTNFYREEVAHEAGDFDSRKFGRVRDILSEESHLAGRK